ncbi:MAG: glycine cleavage system aminomethyltransferase GcvT [Reichenbachiella sp.]
MDVKNITLNEIHISLGAKMVPFAGFNMPVRYSSDKEEHHCIRKGVGVFDVSHMGEFLLEGPHALDLIQRVTSNDASKIIDGQAQYSCLPNEEGGIVDDLIIYRMDAEKYFLVVNASNIEKDWNWISKFNSQKVPMTNLSDSYSLFAVQGPKAIETLQKLTEVNLSDINYYHFTEGRIADIDEVIISATGYTGAGGFELYVKNESAIELWNQVFEAGAEFDIKPIGLGARDTLRLEMGYCLYGNDINDTTSPLEAGLGWITKFTKEFTNSAALAKQKEEGVTKKLVGFIMEEKGIPRGSYDISDSEGNNIGQVTSGTMSPSLGKGVGLGYVQVGQHTAGTEIYIQIRNKSLKAIITKLPLYKG